MPGDPSYQVAVQIVVYYGHEDPEPINGNCVPLAGSPDPSTFAFTVNGVDRTSYFTVYSDHAVGTNVPLVDHQLNTLVATITGNDAGGAPRVEVATQNTNVNTTPSTPSANSPKREVFISGTFPYC